MAAPTSPTALRLELARRLKRLRETAGKSLADVAEELECSLAKASRMETGVRTVQALDIKVLCRFYGVSPDVRKELTDLATEARKRGWWQDLRALDEQTQTYIGLESACSEVRTVELLRIPGLLQTPDYAREWVPRLRPPDFFAPGVVDDIVRARTRRQERLTRGELSFSAVIDEAALVRYSDDLRPVMADQVAHLIDTASWPGVRLQIAPLAAGPHPALDSPFLLLRFPDGQLDDVVFVEGLFGNQFIERTDLVTAYHRIFEHLTSSVALGPEDSLTWLRRHLDQLGAASDAAPSPPDQ